MTVNITANNLERMERAVENKFSIEPLEKPRVAVTDHTSESGKAHVVDVDGATCTCDDFEYNCSNGVYCKHIWYVAFRRTGML